jgi:hypothetical protein
MVEVLSLQEVNKSSVRFVHVQDKVFTERTDVYGHAHLSFNRGMGILVRGLPLN